MRVAALTEPPSQGSRSPPTEGVLGRVSTRWRGQRFDVELISAVREAVTVPIIASGGAGALHHFAPAVEAGGDAVLAASVFHYGEMSIGEVKNALVQAGHVVR